MLLSKFWCIQDGYILVGISLYNTYQNTQFSVKSYNHTRSFNIFVGRIQGKRISFVKAKPFSYSIWKAFQYSLLFSILVIHVCLLHTILNNSIKCYGVISSSGYQVTLSGFIIIFITHFSNLSTGDMLLLECKEDCRRGLRHYCEAGWEVGWSRDRWYSSKDGTRFKRPDFWEEDCGCNGRWFVWELSPV